MFKTQGWLVLLLLAAPCFAEENAACLLEGTFSMGDMHIEIKDCMENHGISEHDFLTLCSQIADAGGKLGAPPTVTYSSSCPADQQAVCKGFLGQPVHSFYYKREESSLGGVETGCTLQGGEWEAGS